MINLLIQKWLKEKKNQNSRILVHILDFEKGSHTTGACINVDHVHIHTLYLGIIYGLHICCIQGRNF